MTETCSTCQMWGRDYPRVCDRVGDMTVVADPEKFFDLDYGASDDYGLYARLVTGPDFGCVHHVPKRTLRKK